MVSITKNKNGLFILLGLALILALGPGLTARAQEGDGDRDEAARQAFFDRIEADVRASLDDPEAPAMGATPCVDGFAGPYACENVDLLAFLPLGSIGGGSGNDIWGWIDPLDGKEYALVGRSSGTSFVDISDPVNPVYLGNLPTHTSSSTWRDIKVYNNYAFVVSEAGSHGMQVFDLTRLREVTNPPETFTEDAHFSGFGSAHNLVINEDSGYAFKVGGSTCNGGLHFVNIQDPLNPTDAGCYSGDGYTHDAQCVIYSGPDTNYQGDEICFAYNEDTLTIVNATNKNSPTLIKKQGYAGSAYTHQGWVTEDQVYLLLDDELDEQSFGHNTRTRVWDISDLDNPVVIGFFDSDFDSIDHNQYMLDGYAYQSNYTSGLQILDLVDVAAGSLSRAGYFDTYTPNDSASFNGTWSNYPYYESGVVVVNDINSGLFILQPTITPDYTISADSNALEVCVSGQDATGIDLDAKGSYTGVVTLSAVGLPAGSAAAFDPNPVIVPGSSVLTVTVSSTSPGIYPFDVHGDDGAIEHDEGITLHVHDGAPVPPVLVFPADGATGVDPEVTFTWNQAPSSTSYAIEVATDSGFNNIVDSATVGGTTYPIGVPLDSLTTYFWRVQAGNSCGPSAFSAPRSFTTAELPSILLVDDDDDNPDVRVHYSGVLDTLGWDYDVWETGASDIEPALGTLSLYEVVLWFSGDRFGGPPAGPAGPSSTTEGELADWLDGGGCFFLSSQDYRYDKGTITSFMTNYLGVSNIEDDTGNYISVTGQNIFGGLGSYTLFFPYSDFTDPITAGNGGLDAMLGNNGNVGGVTKDAGNYKTSFWAFGFETLPSAGQNATMETFIDWCDLDLPPAPPAAFDKTSPANGETGLSLDPTLAWEASAGAKSYEYCYDTSDDDSCDGPWVSNGTSTSAGLSGLSAGTTYFWQIRATNLGGTTYADGAATAFWSFTTDGPTQELRIYLPLILKDQ